MITFSCYHNLSAEALRKVEPWANRLAEKKAAGYEIGPERADEEMTEAQILLRKIGRIVFSATLQLNGTELIPMSYGPDAAGAGPAPPPPPPLSQSERDEINQRLAQAHDRAMARLHSIWRQLEMLNGGPEAANETEPEAAPAKVQPKVAAQYEEMLAPSPFEHLPHVTIHENGTISGGEIRQMSDESMLRGMARMAKFNLFEHKANLTQAGDIRGRRELESLFNQFGLGRFLTRNLDETNNFVTNLVNMTPQEREALLRLEQFVLGGNDNAGR